jgi:hypothetical protein
MDLSKAQRNELFQAVVTGHLNPADCELVKDGETFRINHHPTGSAFWGLSTTPSSFPYSCTMRLGTDPSSKRLCRNLQEVFNMIQSWANQVAEWQETPDLWELRHNWKFLGEQQYEDSTNATFSPEEQDAISVQLAAIKESVKKTYALTAEQEAKIDAQFEEAKQAARRLGRKDWILLFAGGIFSLILTDVITPDIAQHILMMATHGLAHLFASAPRSIRAE